MELCGIDGCRLLKGHSGNHNKYPEHVWRKQFNEKDADKINKAGYATPRGGNKGAYQNHVYRNNKVIIPYEKLDSVNLENYADGYVIRLRPDQYFTLDGKVHPDVLSRGNVIVGENAFVLYRTHEQLTQFPPLDNWTIRHMEKNGKIVARRTKKAVDKGEYVLRIFNIGENKKINEGIPQGIFAPEYATEEVNFLSKSLLAWLIINTEDSPYDEQNFSHLRAILTASGVINEYILESNFIIVNGVTCCPLCQKKINYSELHEMINFEGADSLSNSQEQIEGSTRSTKVNLFHMVPLCYESLEHKPDKIAWGHAICNTVLGQRRCVPLSELKETGYSLDLPDGRTAWASSDLKFIRSEQGEVWIKISDMMEQITSE